jgi:TPR repeat protein
LRKAALNAAPFAGCRLGTAYLRGSDGVAQDNVEAYRWTLLQKASDDACMKRLAELSQNMTPAEHARAEADPGVEPAH